MISSCRLEGKGAARRLWIAECGPVAPGLFVCHHCDEPLCVTFDHLFLGTHQDNMIDMARKGRHRNQRKTTCPRGHKLSGSNLYVWRGRRICKTCNRIAAVKYNHGRRK